LGIEILTEFELIVDSYDEAIQRPKDYQQHKNTADCRFMSYRGQSHAPCPVWPMPHARLYLILLKTAVITRGLQTRQTKKNQLIVMPSGKEIVDMIVEETKATADIKIWINRLSELSLTQRFQGDKADVGELLIDTSYKKKRIRDITPAQKTENYSKAKKRIFCRAFN